MTGLSNAELPGPVERREFKFKPLFDANFLNFLDILQLPLLELGKSTFPFFCLDKG